MEYSIPYIFVLFILGVCAFLYESANGSKQRAHINIIAITIFLIFFGFRGYVFTDWTSYTETIKNVSWEDIFQISSDESDSVIREPLFTLLCCMCSLISRELSFVFFVTTLIDLFLFVRVLNRWNIKNLAFVWILFITYEGLIIMFNLLRNQIAILIFLNALEYIDKRKPIPYFSLCFASLGFHLSSLLYFPLYFFLHKKLNKWIFLTIYASFLIFYLSKLSIISIIISALGLEGILAAKIKLYTELYSANRELSISGTFFSTFFIILLSIYYKKITETLKYRVMAINSLLIFFFFFYIFADFKVLSERMSILFIFPFWFLWIDLTQCLTILNNKKILCSIIFLYSLYTTAFNMTIPVQEYDNILFGAKSEKERLKIFNKTYESEN